MLIWVGVLASGYAVVCTLAYLLQGALLFFPSRRLEATPSALGMSYEDVALRLADGTAIHAWFVPCDRALGTALWCHGNAGNVSHRLGVLKELHDLGIATLIFDYPGYGQSGGSPSEAGCYAAAEAAYEHLREARRVRAEKLVIWGRSLGGTVAVELASRRSCAALIVESTMTSVTDVAKRHYFWLPVALLLRHRFDAASRIARVPGPKLFVHSKDDEVVPYDLGRELYARASEPKRFVDILGGHNTGQQQSGERYTGALYAFLREVLSE